MDERTILAIEGIIGYTFADKSLLSSAFTHTSYANENGGESNERLEFLGDSALGFLVSGMLYNTLSEDEGDLSIARAGIVSREPLSAAVSKMDILQYYQMGVGAQKESNISHKFKSNLFEAIVGAIYVDCYDLDIVKKFVVKFLLANLQKKRIEDYKTQLQEILQSEKTTWNYDTIEIGGKFECSLRVKGETYVGKGRKKRDAEQEAAKNALKFISKKI